VTQTPPLPPVELRALVSCTDVSIWDNPTGALVFPDVPPEAYAFVLDLGCGAGRVARQLLQQRPQPQRYLGVDLHRGLVEWCRRNLAPCSPGFDFQHHDVYEHSLNPGGQKAPQPLPVADGEISLMLALSVFTHLLEEQAEHYLAEAARALRPDGLLLATFFLFDKRDYPMMQEFQNALFINPHDPSNAVIFDRGWVRTAARRAGLVIAHAVPPTVRGFQWMLWLRPTAGGASEVELPEDAAPYGHVRPPERPPDADKFGL
jgi:SAM-dependent methyltransferase